MRADSSDSTAVIRSNLGTDPDLGTLVTDFVDGLPGRLADIMSAADRQDWSALAHLAHQLSGAFGSYGFHQLTPVTVELEQAARSGQSAQVVLDTLEEFLQLCACVRAG